MNITYTLNITPAEALDLIEELVGEVDYINWEGNEDGGEASGKGFAGHYTTKACADGTKLKITIDKKPFYVPAALIKSQVAGALEEYIV
jgi:hypothetical protein